MHTIEIRTTAHSQMVDITGQVAEFVSKMGVKEGACMVWIPHTTAGVTINENADSDVVRDILSALDKAVPWKADYRHGEGNSAAHVKASMMGSSVLIPVENGRLVLGTWQGVYFCEFDGPRSRRVYLQMLSSVGM